MNAKKNLKMPNQVEEFNAYRSKMNDKILADDNKIIKRIFNIDEKYFITVTKFNIDKIILEFKECLKIYYILLKKVLKDISDI